MVIVDLPSENGDLPYVCKSLPEGIWSIGSVVESLHAWPSTYEVYLAAENRSYCCCSCSKATPAPGYMPPTVKCAPRAEAKTKSLKKPQNWPEPGQYDSWNWNWMQIAMRYESEYSNHDEYGYSCFSLLVYIYIIYTLYIFYLDSQVQFAMILEYGPEHGNHMWQFLQRKWWQSIGSSVPNWWVHYFQAN